MTLDWKPRFDERSRAFRLEAVKGEVRDVEWRHGPVLDQGMEGACVGFSATGNLASTKRQLTFPDGNVVARTIYNYAKTVDEWEGENYDGTSVLAGMKALKANGYITEYRWAFGLQDALWGLSWRGPLCIGVNWYSGMTDPDASGFLHKTGSLVGGHAILVSGVDHSEGFVTLTNSWGPDWGVKGQAKLSLDDFGALLSEDGECATIIKAVPKKSA